LGSVDFWPDRPSSRFLDEGPQQAGAGRCRQRQSFPLSREGASSTEDHERGLSEPIHKSAAPALRRELGRDRPEICSIQVFAAKKISQAEETVICKKNGSYSAQSCRVAWFDAL
jgi:hypothetical protein